MASDDLKYFIKLDFHADEKSFRKQINQVDKALVSTYNNVNNVNEAYKTWGLNISDVYSGSVKVLKISKEIGTQITKFSSLKTPIKALEPIKVDKSLQGLIERVNKALNTANVNIGSINKGIQAWETRLKSISNNSTTILETYKDLSSIIPKTPIIDPIQTVKINVDTKDAEKQIAQTKQQVDKVKGSINSIIDKEINLLGNRIDAVWDRGERTTLKVLDDLVKKQKELTDNGFEFSNKIYKIKKGTPAKKEHIFAPICRKYDIEHRFTLPYRPQTNGMVENTQRKYGGVVNELLLVCNF